MKIALIRGPFLRPNGVLPWEYIHNKYSDVEVIAFESDPPRFDTSILNLPIRRLLWLDGKFSLFGHDYIISKILSKLRFPSNILLGLNKIIDEFDIIHVSENYHFFSFQGAILSKKRNKIFVFTAAENIPYPPFQRNPITLQIKKIVNESASAVTTTTPMAKRALIYEGVNPDKVEVIPNALDFRYFDKGPKDPSKVNLPEEFKETFNILFVGRLTEQKGIYYLIKAFKKLEKKFDDLRLILVGPNYLNWDEYKSLILKDSRICHITYIPNTKMKYIYNICDVFILPSIRLPNNEEQFGMAVLEAMACAKPTIVTNVGGLPYIARHKKTSLIIPEKSDEAIVNAVLKLYNDDDLRKSLGKLAYHYVRRKYSKEVIGKKLYIFYKKLLEK